jgi:hypothetical protein
MEIVVLTRSTTTPLSCDCIMLNVKLARRFDTVNRSSSMLVNICKGLNYLYKATYFDTFCGIFGNYQANSTLIVDKMPNSSWAYDVCPPYSESLTW